MFKAIVDSAWTWAVAAAGATFGQALYETTKQLIEDWTSEPATEEEYNNYINYVNENY